MMLALALVALEDTPWERVWKAVQPPAAVQAAAKPEVPRELLQTAGAPARVGDATLFRFQAPAGTRRVYLAGTFNGWAANNAGKVSDTAFAMRHAGDQLWYALELIDVGEVKYKFVIEDASGIQSWVSDPSVKPKDADGNSIFEVMRDHPGPPAIRWGQSLPRERRSPTSERQPLSPSIQRVWVRPGEPNSLTVSLPDPPAGAVVRTDILGPFGTPIVRLQQPARAGTNTIPIPPLANEGGYLTRITVRVGNRVVSEGQTVLSVVRNIADDLRYGFFATYRQWHQDYDKPLAALADLHLNAVEFYDYFPAHGNYAPTEQQYTFEPFGIPIDARDVRDKIIAGRKRNILSIAYVAAYAASESVYRRFPYPMRDERGIPKVFNGRIEAEDEADKAGRPKWFWIMDVSEGSPWYQHIMGEFRRTLDDAPGDLVAFDGFEIDSYGDAASTRFFAKGSPRNGDLLQDVLRDFVSDVRTVTRQVKPHGLVSFNSVNEFGIEPMQGVTDFLFMEIWRGYRDRLEALSDIAFRRREPRRQRVVMKVYPADMEPPASAFTAAGLRRVLGAIQTGGGSLMIAGEPNPDTGQPHALNSLFYPDHQPMPRENQDILRAYARHDALLYGFSHGPMVFNTTYQPFLPGGYVRSFANKSQQTLTLQLMRTGEERRWTVHPANLPATGFDWTIPLPGGVAPRDVWFSTPDHASEVGLRKLPFRVRSGHLGVHVPAFQAHGTVLLRFGKNE